MVLKSTVSLNDPNMPLWGVLANDIVVNEKVVVGSRCGPLDMALVMMTEHQEIRELLAKMLDKVFPMAQAVEALQYAQQKGVMKVQVRMDT